MGAIGGIMELKRYGADITRLNIMKRSMCLRGGEDSAVYIGEGIAMLYSGEYTSDRQPNIYERAGRTVAVCIDAEGLKTSAVLEKYLVYGAEFLEHLAGSFSLALYDSSRGALFLARDKNGKKPLFYTASENTVCFASEIKGILDAVGGYAQVEREILAMHLISPVGIYTPAQIYSDILEVKPGECVIFTRLGMSRFFYRNNSDEATKNDKRERREILTLYSVTDLSKLEEYLREALIAFDYPQFDRDMPSLLQTLSKISGQKKSISFYDDVRRRNLTYAYMREDRLGMLYGVRCKGVLPPASQQNNSPDISLEGALRERFFSIKKERLGFLKSILGDKKLYLLMRELEKDTKKEEDTEYNIRILAMLCQAVEWGEARRIVLK